MVFGYQHLYENFQSNIVTFCIICLSIIVSISISSFNYVAVLVVLVGLVTFTTILKIQKNLTKILLTVLPMMAFNSLRVILKDQSVNYLSALDSTEIILRCSVFSILEVNTLFDEALLGLLQVSLTGYDFGFTSAKSFSSALVNAFLLVFFYSLSKSINSEKKINSKLKNNLIDTINSGIIRISKGKIAYMNKVLKNNIMKIYPICKQYKIWEEQEVGGIKATQEMEIKVSNFLQQNSEFILETLFGMKYLSDFSKFKKYEFSFYSKAEYLLKDEKVYFEVYAQATSETEVELILNDYTKEVLAENKIKEGNYFSLLHSKIAHEIKNSLISISELTDRTKSSPNKHFETQIINQIKAMCSYMLIIVKDLAIFKVDYEKCLKVDKNECNLEETIVLCEEVARVMLNKQGKDSRVVFETGLNKNVPDTLFTDETKLRQILLNLISNAVKFTSYGVVSLHIITQGSNVVFKVRDSGVGMEGYEECLNKGTGLKLCQILTKKLGQEIKSESVLGEGTTFSFSVPCENLKTNNSYNYLSLEKFVDNPLGPKFSDRRGSIVSTQTVIINNLVLVSPIRRLISDLTINNITNKDLSNISKLRLEDDESSSSSSFADDDDSSLPSLEIIHENMKLNVMIVDDEPLVRSSTKKVVETAAKHLGINLNVIEAKDGVETLYLIYKYHSKGQRIAFILSDQNMIFMQGSNSAEIINKTFSHLIKVPDFYIVSSYEDSFGNYNQNYIKNVYSKPLNKSVVENMLKQYG